MKTRKAKPAADAPAHHPRPDSAAPATSLLLRFSPDEEIDGLDLPLREDISSLAIVGRTLFCACDETATIERLVYDPDEGVFREHRNLDLNEAFDLAVKGKDGEMDIEGIAYADGFLWISGSHSLKRDTPDPGDADLHDLHDVDWDANRGFLGRVPVMEFGDGVFHPVGAIETLDSAKNRRAAMLVRDGKGRTIIRRMLAREPLLAPFMNVPAKENGFDVEGLAVSGERMFLGLRGPVIGGRAILVELKMKATKDGFLKPARIDGKRRYKLHAIDLGGLGIRDILFDGERLLILGGVTMDLSGPQAVFVLDQVPEEGGPIASDQLRRALELPLIPDADHAEGIAILDRMSERRLVVVYDSPAPHRLDSRANTLKVDLFPVP